MVTRCRWQGLRLGLGPGSPCTGCVPPVWKLYMLQEPPDVTGMLLALDRWPMATWFDLWTTWFNILLARTGHLKLCKLVEGHLTNPTSGCESLKLGNKNRPQLLFKAQSKSPFYFSEIAFDLGHLNLPSTCQMSHLLSKLSDIPVSATRTSSSEKVCTGLQSWLLGITSREVPGDQVRTCLQSWPPDVTSRCHITVSCHIQ